MLRIRELSLAGFGIYEEPTRFLVPDGPAIFWGANETGKSTFLWGIAAVWFGLPQNSDPTKVGTSRFRSFSKPEQFWGELVWDVEGETYRLHRNFDSHQVKLTRDGTEGSSVLFQGEHNPQGRSSSGKAFPSKLKKIIGFARMDLFLETFCLSQPFVGDATIESELQHLISGSRSVKVDDVLGRLFARIKEQTKTTGDLGLVRPGTSRPTNQREDGRVDELRTELARARLDLELGRKELEKINSEGIETEDAKAQIQQLRDRLEERRARLATLDRWTELQAEKTSRTETVRRLEASATELKKLNDEREQVEAELTDFSQMLQDAPSDAAARLEALANADRELQRRQDEADSKSDEREKLEREFAETKEKLEGEYKEFRGRPDFIDTRNRLREAVARRDTARTEIESLEDEIEKREHDLDSTRNIDQVLVSSCQSHCESLRDALERIEKLDGKLAELRQQMEERGYLEDHDRMEQLNENLELEGELKECTTLLREQKANVILAHDQVEEAEARARQVLEAPVVEEPVEEFVEVMEPEAPASNTRLFGSLALGLIGGCLTFVGGTQAGLPAWAILAAGSVLVLLVTFVASRPPKKTRTVRKVQNGSAANHEELTPGERLRRRMMEGQPTDSEISRPNGSGELNVDEAKDALAEAERRLEEIQERATKIEARLEELREHLGDYARTSAAELARMEERWKLLDEQFNNLSEERAEILEERFGAAGDDDWKETPVAEATEELEQLLLLPGGPSPDDNPSVGELIDWVVKLDSADWEAFAAAETARADSVREVETLRVRLSEARKRVTNEDEIKELEAKMAPFDLETDPKWLLNMQDECADLERAFNRLQTKLEESHPESQIESQKQKVEEAWQKLAEDWNSAERPSGDAFAQWADDTRKQLQSLQKLRDKAAGFASQIPSLLRSAGLSDANELETRLTSEKAALGGNVRESEELEARELTLSDGGAGLSPEKRAELFQSRREKELAAQKEDEAALAEAETELRERLRKQATLEGTPLPNLAALELSIRQMEDELGEREIQTEALTHAFKWVEEAAETYRSTYRESLGERIGHHFQGLTGNPDRRVELGETFELRVRDGEGRILETTQLSQGARDQLMLSLRLGVSDLLSTSVALPFIFDDPFVHFDEQRLAQLQTGLKALDRSRQWILLTHRKEMASWADPVFTERIGESTGTTGRPSGDRVDDLVASPSNGNGSNGTSAGRLVENGSAAGGGDPEADTATGTDAHADADADADGRPEHKITAAVSITPEADREARSKRGSKRRLRKKQRKSVEEQTSLFQSDASDSASEEK